MAELYDVAIVGAGPAGLTAGIYAGRAMLKTIIFEKAVAGGLMALTDKLENYPGIPSVTGGELSETMSKQALSFGCELNLNDVEKIEKKDDIFHLHTRDGVFQSKTVIYASGSTPRKANVKGEQEFSGRGVSYCAVCDGAFYRNLRIAVVGGGDSALKEALFLTKYGKEVVIIHRRQEFRAEKIIQQKVRENEKISFMLDSVVEEISGTQFVEKLKIKNVKTGEITEHNFDGLFVFIGYEPHTEPVEGLVELSERGRILTNKNMETKTPGLFCAGDIVDKLVNQVATAVGDGAIAATAAEKYIENLK